jgi:hypothetical protein
MKSDMWLPLLPQRREISVADAAHVLYVAALSSGFTGSESNSMKTCLTSG